MAKKIIIYILFGLFGSIIILNKISTKKIILDVSNRPDTVRSEINFIGDSITYAIIYRTVDPYNDSLFYVAYYKDSKGFERRLVFKGHIDEYNNGDTVFFKKNN